MFETGCASLNLVLRSLYGHFNLRDIYLLHYKNKNISCFLIKL